MHGLVVLLCLLCQWVCSLCNTKYELVSALSHSLAAYLDSRSIWFIMGIEEFVFVLHDFLCQLRAYFCSPNRGAVRLLVESAC